MQRMNADLRPRGKLPAGGKWGCRPPGGQGERLWLLRWGPAEAPPAASDFSRISVSVAVGVIASASILRWMIDGLPDARAAANAAGKSTLFSTTAPYPPNASA